MSIIDLMQTPRDQQDIGWLKKMLQFAIELEVSTLPPYLSGLWTINSHPSPVNHMILSIIDEEMVHLGLACNMLTAIGGTPSIYAPFQTREIHYPGHLPGGVRPELTVHLAGLSKDYVQNIYMQIEYPEERSGRSGARPDLSDHRRVLLGDPHGIPDDPAGFVAVQPVGGVLWTGNSALP